MIDVLLVTNYWHFAHEKASSRYGTLAKLVTEAGMSLEVVTSSFRHATKAHRTDSTGLTVRPRSAETPCTVSLIPEPGYRKNVSIGRLRSHRIFARNVIRYLEARETPDVIYCVVPSLDVAERVGSYARTNGIPLILDIQDLWPEAFRMSFNLPVISHLLFGPMRLQADRIYSYADQIVAVSETYVERAMRSNARCDTGLAVYLGVELAAFDLHATEAPAIDKAHDAFWVGYAGALGHSYDLDTVIDALARLAHQGLPNLELIVMGDGPRRSEFEDRARRSGIAHTFTGNLPYPEMVRTLACCDVAVNPIVRNAAASIINKHADYFAAGKPVVSSQDSPEFRALLERSGAGFSCGAEDVSGVTDALYRLYESPALRTEMGAKSRALAVSRFDRAATYPELVEMIRQCAVRQ